MRVSDFIAFLAVVIQTMAGFGTCVSPPGITLRIMSYNVRYDSMPDDISVQQTLNLLPKALPHTPAEYNPSLGELPWSTRRIYVANDVLSNGAHIYVPYEGGQELLNRQVKDLQELLGENWAWVGVGRDDGEQSGEYSPIFYRRDVLKLHDWDTFWLSTTPFEQSKYPGAGSKRICTTAHFSIIHTNSQSVFEKDRPQDFTVLNTHLDDQSSSQRQLGASLILHRAKFEAIKSKRPVALTGDFNSPPDDAAYQIITGQADPLELNQTFLNAYTWTEDEGEGFENFVLKDLLGETLPHRRSGHYATFTDFAATNDTSAFERLDYVFGGAIDAWDCKSYRVGSNIHDNGVYASDHRPVSAEIYMNVNYGSRLTGSQSPSVADSVTHTTIHKQQEVHA